MPGIRGVGWVALALLFAACGSTATTPAASGGSGGGGAIGTGGAVAGVDSGNAAPGDAAMSTGELPCRTYDYGCSCSPGVDGNAKECTAVAVAGDKGAVGLCCKGDQCLCSAFACITRVADGYCFCSGVKAALKEMGTLAADCSAVVKANPGITCCQEPTGCTCRPGQCSFAGAMVPSCDATSQSQRWCSNAAHQTTSCP